MIGKYLAGETDGAEQSQVEEWIAESERNRKYFEQLRVVFDRAARVKDIPTFDTDEAWSRMKARLSGESKVRPLGADGPSAWTWAMRIAAGLTVVAVAALFVYQFTRPAITNTYTVASDQTTVTDTLPDGSEVVLNRSSQLSYAYNRKQEKHIVTLKGEAYFTVSDSGEGDFFVQTGEVLIEDIGTSFNVKALPESVLIEVTVDEGEVQFYTHDQPGLKLTAGETGVYDKTSRNFSKVATAPNAAAYKSKSFHFRAMRLKDIVDDLNAVYNKPIIIEDHLYACRLTVAFEQEEIEEITEVIAQTLGLTADIQSDKILLKGDGCE